MDPRWILQSPIVYMTFQRMVGGTHMRDVCVELLRARPGERIVDIGCGPAYYLTRMPAVEYHGFDTDERYIAHARRRFGDRAKFHCEQFGEEQARRVGEVDAVLLMGLLHHLDDDACRRLLGLLAKSLRPGGRVVSLDTVIHARQNPAEHLLAIKDRGRYVRSPEAFVALAETSFERVRGGFSDRWWIPSVYWHMTLTRPKRTES